MTEQSARRNRLEDLLVQHATEGVGQAERHEIESLSAQFADIDASGFERAAALIWLVANETPESMPAALQERILRKAGDGLD